MVVGGSGGRQAATTSFAIVEHKNLKSVWRGIVDGARSVGRPHVRGALQRCDVVDLRVEVHMHIVAHQVLANIYPLHIAPPRHRLIFSRQIVYFPAPTRRVSGGDTHATTHPDVGLRARSGGVDVDPETLRARRVDAVRPTRVGVVGRTVESCNNHRRSLESRLQMDIRVYAGAFVRCPAVLDPARALQADGLVV